MAVKLRLRRMGRRKHPVYSLVATDTRSPRDGRFIEDLGRYEPVAEPIVVRINEARILYWLRQGAQPSDTVRNLLSREGVMLHFHLLRKGKSAEEIEQAVAEFRARRGEAEGTKTTAADRRRAALEAERKAAAEIAKKAEEERKAREAELEAQRQEAEAAERAAREAADAEAAAAAETASEATEEAPAEEAQAPAEEPAAETTEAEEPAAEEPAAEVAPEEIPEATPAEEVQKLTEEEAPAEEPAEEPVAEAAPEEPAAEAAAEEATPEEPAAETASEEPAAEAAEASEAEEPAAEADDLTKLWGIGKVFAGLLNDHGITTFAQLAETDVEQLRAIVNESGSSAAAANEESWTRQARLAADGDQAGLDAYVEELKNA